LKAEEEAINGDETSTMVDQSPKGEANRDLVVKLFAGIAKKRDI